MTKLVNFRASEDEIALWRAAADLNGTSLSGWARYLLNLALDSVEDEGPYASALTPRERIAALAAV